MTITLSESVRVLAERQAGLAGYTDLTAYLEWLVERADGHDETRVETLAALREGLADATAGRTRPAHQVFQDLATKHGIPPSTPAGRSRLRVAS